MAFESVSINNSFPPCAATMITAGKPGTRVICSQMNVDRDTDRCGPLGFEVSYMSSVFSNRANKVLRDLEEN